MNINNKFYFGIQITILCTLVDDSLHYILALLI